MQRLRDGRVETFDLPAPAWGDHEVFVQTHYSVISSGTELSRLVAARSSLLGKALKRPAEFKKAVETLRRKGFVTTYRKASNRLKEFNKIGYSSAGRVVAKGSAVDHLSVGDRVALAGSGYATHAEYTVVPKRVCVKIPEGVSTRSAAFTTIGSIALQGVRQLNPQMGERIVVIGLGLIGQLTLQLLLANSVKVIGLDLFQERLSCAEKAGCRHLFLSSDSNLEQAVNELTDGFGVDGVIITASTRSNAPINLAGRLARTRGRIVIVGNVGHSFERKTFYEKELSILMSCSYGAGRYDPMYEVQGIDYPQAYINWTIERNMKTFIWLLSLNRISVDHIISKVFKIDEAPEAYNCLLEKKPDTFGLLFEYDTREKDSFRQLRVKNIQPDEPTNNFRPNIGIIGVGSYAKSFIIPNIRKSVRIMGLASRNSSSLQLPKVDHINDSAILTTDPHILLGNEKMPTVIIATRHSTHFEFLLEGLKNRKNVYVEKPVVTNEEQLQILVDALCTQRGNICVGFNRRYAPAIRKLQEKITASPLDSRYTVMADPFPEDYWALREEEGGIVVGEIIHFVDLFRVLHNSNIRKVFAKSNLDSINRGSIHISLFFENKSTATISYIMGSSMKSSKENIELLYHHDRVALDGFKRVTSSRYGKIYRSLSLDMGREKLFGDVLGEFCRGKIVQNVGGLINAHSAVFAIKRSIATDNIQEVKYCG